MLKRLNVVFSPSANRVFSRANTLFAAAVTVLLHGKSGTVIITTVD
jgi:hypothetical protein